MESLVITPTSKKDSLLLKSIATKMGFDVKVLSDSEKEDMGLLRAMFEGRKTKLVSKEEVMKNLRG